MDERRTITLAIADDSPIFLEGLTTVLAMKYPHIKLVGTARDGAEAVAVAERARPDVFLVDIQMPKVDGVTATRRIKAMFPQTKVVILTTFNERELIRGAMEAGAHGYLLKEIPTEEVVEDIEAVALGNLLIPEKVAAALPWAAGDGSSDQSNGPDNLDLERRKDLPIEIRSMPKREREVLQLVLRNQSNQMIADQLFISERTVRNYMSKIYDRVGVKNRTSLMLWAIEHSVSM